MNILQVIKDRRLFRHFVGEDLSSWQNWATALRCLYGLKLKTPESRALVETCTGRESFDLPEGGFSTALFLVGRRSGKSKISAVIGAYEALFGGAENRLAKGETGLVAVLSVTRYQAGIVWRYLRAIFEAPLLRQEVLDTKESTNTLKLRNGIDITVLVGDWRTVRGPSLCCAILDELCFFGLSEESRVLSDTELVRALRPALITTGGKLIGISSKYSKKGWAYSTWLKQHGSNEGVSPSFVSKWTTLVWDSPSKTMNPTLPQVEIDAAYAEDPAAARSEFGGAWRDDVSQFIERSLVESLVAVGMKERLPRTSMTYRGFADVSGGRNDDAALAIAHNEGSKCVIDLARVWMAPHNPQSVIQQMAEELKRFGIYRVTGDNYAAEFVAGAFRSNGITFTKSELPKSKLYKELLPRLCSKEIVLLDNSKLVDQLSSLERRTRSGGDDVIDHPPTGHDDVANVVAGVAAARPVPVVGGLWRVPNAFAS